MKIYHKSLIERKKIKEIVCNKCGETIDIKNYKDFLNIYKAWGYNSNYDSEHHEFEICENCYKSFISSFKIAPSKKRRKRLFFF